MTRKKYVLKNKTKFLSFLFITTFVTFMLIYTLSVSGHQEPQYQTVVVHSGDTLWSIAEKYCNNTDIREYIYNIKKINNMDTSVLYENTAVLIPVKE